MEKMRRRFQIGWRSDLAGVVAALAFLGLGLAVGCSETVQDPGLQLVDASPEATSGGYATERRGSIDVDLQAGSTSDLPDIGQKIVKTGSLQLGIGEGTYADVRERIRSLANSSGGYLQGESSSQDASGLTHGTVTVRVPAEKFDEVFAAIAVFGEPGQTSVKTSDMTQEYVDLESRLRHLQAEEAFYLGLIDKAQTVSDMISISDRLSDIQQEKETVMGRQAYLDNQVAYATITATINETAPGAASRGFWSTVSSAFSSFGLLGKYLGVGILYALPYLLGAGLIFLGFRGFKRKRRPA